MFWTQSNFAWEFFFLFYNRNDKAIKFWTFYKFKILFRIIAIYFKKWKYIEILILLKNKKEIFSWIIIYVLDNKKYIC